MRTDSGEYVIGYCGRCGAPLAVQEGTGHVVTADTGSACMVGTESGPYRHVAPTVDGDEQPAAYSGPWPLHPDDTLSDPSEKLNAAQRYALCKALMVGLEAQITADAPLALAWAAEHGVKSFKTEWGQVTVTEPNGRPASESIVVDEAALRRWVLAEHPEHAKTVTIADPAYATHLRTDARISGDVVCLSDGTVVEWAAVKRTAAVAPPPPSLTRPGANATTKAANAAAREYVATHLASLGERVRPAIEAP